MNLKTLMVAALAAGFAVSSANALTITNRDAKAHKVTIIEGDKVQDNMLEPSQTLESVCEQGCIIRLNDQEGSEYEAGSQDIVSIEEDALFLDEQAEQAEQGSGSDEQPVSGAK